MIKLYGFGPAFNLPDPSPFVTKVLLTLIINDIPFERIDKADNLRHAPKQKLPFIDDDGEIIADSAFIIDYLNEKYNADLDGWLNDTQKATAQLISKSLDENFYWCIVHSRWINDDTWPIIRKQFFDGMPFPLNKLVPIIARRSTQKQIIGHGIGKHSDGEILAIAKKTLSSLSTLLGDKPFMFGDKLSSLDITMSAMVGALTLSSIDNEMSRLARSYPNLCTFAEKTNKQYLVNTNQ